MNIVIKKFGGTSLATLECIAHVADIVHEALEQGESVVVVVSAMAGTTENLLSNAMHMSSHAYSEEVDVVLASGEQVTAGLLSLALRKKGIRAQSLMGWQIPLLTTDHGMGVDAGTDVLSVHTETLLQLLKEGVVPVVAGFQGITNQGRITLLGRGGSDTTAVVIAAALKASACQIFTDVEGVYSADPFVVHNAKHYPVVGYQDMMVLTHYGAKVMHQKAVKWAAFHHMDMQILSTFAPTGKNTLITESALHIAAITHKAIISWTIKKASPEHISGIYNYFQKRELAFLDWNLSPEGLRFITYRDGYGDLPVPADCVIEEKTLVVVIGASAYNITDMLKKFPVEQYLFLQPQDLLLQKKIHHTNVIGLVMDTDCAYETMRALHTWMGLDKKLPDHCEKIHVASS